MAMARVKSQRSKHSEGKRAAAEMELRVGREATRERATDHVESVMQRPRQIILEAIARGMQDRDVLENARNQVNAIRLAVEEEPDLYPSVTQVRIDEMGQLIDQANEVLDHAPERVLSPSMGGGEKQEALEQAENEKRLEKLRGEVEMLSSWVWESGIELRERVSRLLTLHPSRNARIDLVDALLAGRINEGDFTKQVKTWQWGPLSHDQRDQQRDFSDLSNKLIRGLRELRGRLAEIKELGGDVNVDTKGTEGGSPSAPEQAPIAEKTELQEIEDELDKVGDRLLGVYNRLNTEKELRKDETAPEEVDEVLQAVAKGKPINGKMLLPFKEEHAKAVADMLADLRTLHWNYQHLEKRRDMLENPEAYVSAEESKDQGVGSALETAVVEESAKVYTQKELEQLRREMNKKIGKSFRARDAQRKIQKDTIVAEIDAGGGVVSTIGERGLLGRRRRKEDDNKKGDNTLVREIRRDQRREDEADPEAQKREKLRAFTRAIVDFKNATEELRQRILRFDAEPDEEGLRLAYDLLRETKGRAATAFENIPADSAGYSINQELAATVIRDQERALALLAALRERQEAVGEKTAERTGEAEREAQDRALLTSALEGLSAAQFACGKEMARIQKLVAAGKPWNADDLNFAIRDVREMKRNLEMTLKLVGDTRIDDLLPRAGELEAVSRELREQREELLRLIEQKEHEAVTRRADDEDTLVPHEAPEEPTDLTQATIVPDADRTEVLEQGSWLRKKAATLRRGLQFIWNSWDGVKNLAQETRDMTGAQITGALTGSERGERELGNLSEGARMVTGLLGNLLLTASGTKIFVDLPRYVSQKYFVAGERERLTEELSEIVTQDKFDERDRYQYARSEELAKSIRASRYLTKGQREEMLARLYAVDEAYRGVREEEDEEAKRAIAKIIEKALKTRVSGTRVVKEALNTALIMTGPAAVMFRPGAYGVVSLIERYQNVAGAEPDKNVSEKMKLAFVDGFKEWWKKLHGEVGDTRTKQELNRLAAIATLARALGVVSGGFAETVLVTDLLTKAGAPPLFGESEKDIPDSLMKFADKESTLSDATVFVPEKASNIGEGLEEDPDAFVTAVAGGAPEAVETYTGGIPVGSEVKKFDGIVGALMRVIKANPEAYGFDGDTDIGQELFAKKLAMQMARKEGIVNNDWLSDKSIGQLHIVPERDGDSWKVAFVDKSMHKLSFDEVRDQGYVVKANGSRLA